jgi:hypothetical protein
MTEDNIKMECTVKMLSVYDSFQCSDLVDMLMCIQIPEGLVIFCSSAQGRLGKFWSGIAVSHISD